MNKLKFKIESWLAWKHPLLHSKLCDFRVWQEETRWNIYNKLHRQCCKHTAIKHCATKIVVNPKKALCWDYMPYRCETCGRVIPKRILRQAMNMALFFDYYEEAKYEQEEYLKEQKKKKRTK